MLTSPTPGAHRWRVSGHIIRNRGGASLREAVRPFIIRADNHRLAVYHGSDRVFARAHQSKKWEGEKVSLSLQIVAEDDME